MEKKKYYYTYVVLCTEGSFKGKVYFGAHVTKNLNDNYIGSGKKLIQYLKKYPNGYVREIINFYNSQNELNKAEYNLIHPHLGKDYCLNLTEGGGLRAFPGELHPMYNKHHTKEKKDLISINTKKAMEDKEIRKKCAKGGHKQKGIPKSKESNEKRSNALKGIPLTQERKNNISKACKGHVPPNKGTHMAEDQKQKLREAILGTHRVYDNPEHTKWHMEKD